MHQNLEKIFNFLAAGISISLLLFAITAFIQNPNLLVHPDLFMNYEAGFIRRGFDGQILYSLSNLFNTNILNIAKTYNSITFIIFIFSIILLKIKKKIPIYILFSMSTLMLYFCYIDGGLRKDHVLFLLIILQSLFFSKTQYLKSFWGKFLFIILSIIGTLMHEAFFIITFFPAIIGLWIQSENDNSSFVKRIFLLIPSSILFLFLMFLFKGNLQQAETIIHSYQNLNYNINYLRTLFSKTYFFWDQNYHLKNILYFFLIIFLHSVFILTSVYNNISESSRKLVFLILMILQVLVLVFLCMIAIDYARWVFFCFSTVLIYTYNYSFKRTFRCSRFTTLEGILKRSKYIPFILFFFLTMPHSHWNGKDSLHKNSLIIQLKNKFHHP